MAAFAFSSKSEFFLDAAQLYQLCHALSMVGRTREMYLSTGICAARLNVQSGFSCWLQSIPSVYLGVAG
jgi:hypothetical protein